MNPAVPTILLIEDHDLNREMLARRLTRHGYDIILAADGHEGLRRTRDARPDAILLDMSLPDGWTVARELKAEPTLGATPVIALTAHAMSGDRERALVAGCDEYDTRPIDIERLLGKISMPLEVRVSGVARPDT